MSARVLAHIRRHLVRGIIVVLPLLITVWLLRLLFLVLNDNVTPYVRALLDVLGIPGLERWFARLGIPVIGVMLTVAALYGIGLLGGNLAGRRLVGWIETTILRIPLVRGIYGAARQLLDAFGAGGTRTFSRVVMLEYPRRGLWTLGFVTSESEHLIAEGAEALATVPVFLPTTPNPTSGWMILVPTRDLQVIDMSIEDGIKLIVSGGIVAPANLGRLLRAWTSSPPQG